MAIKNNLAHWEAEAFGTELIEMTLGELLDRRAEELPEKEVSGILNIATWTKENFHKL